jgi:hypothetical protein
VRKSLTIPHQHRERHRQPGNDKITLNGNTNVIEGRGGNDTIDARGANDTIDGAAGNDVIMVAPVRTS